MRFKGMIAALGISAVVLGSSVSFTGCTSMITEEQMAQLQELRKQERSLKQEINSTKSDISNIESEIRSRQSELDDCTEKADFIKSKLGQWPNVWPDYNPENK